MNSSDPVLLLIRRLVARLATPENAAILHQIQKLQLLSTPKVGPARTGGSIKPDGVPRVIGIWEEDPVRAGQFRRRVSSQSADGEALAWADIEVIPPKTTKKRVVLIGESVARGFLYDPDFTPARVLETALNAEVADDAEVVDLACNGIGRRGLVWLVKQAAILQPDAVVLFAGNNWHREIDLDLPEFEILRGLLSEGVQAARDFLSRRIRAAAELALDQVGEFFRSCNIPAVLVIPEFNLADWEPEPQLQCPVLRDGSNERWLTLRAAAEAALESGNPAAVETQARTMLSMDGGSSPVTLRLLAKAKRLVGELDEARRYYEQARDVYGTLHQFGEPNCSSDIQDALRRKAQEHSMAVVDLPRVFQEAYPNQIAGAELFLDYCHLSSTGIRITADAIADSVCGLFGVQRRFSGNLPLPSPQGEAIAHFIAALHNAQWGQPFATIKRLCSEALRFDAGMAENMYLYIDYRTRASSDWAAKSFAQMCADSRFLRYLINGSFDNPVSWDLVRAILNTSDSHTKERCLSALLKHKDWSVIELTKDARSRCARPCIARRPAFSVEKEPVSSFTFFRATPTKLFLTLTCRAFGGRGGDGRLVLNGRHSKSLAIPARWGTTKLLIPEDEIQAGLNEIRIEWPVPNMSWDRMIAAGQERLERNEIPDLFPTYAEVYKLELALGESR